MQRQAYTCDREAIKKAGFPDTPVYCGWGYRPKPEGGKPDKVKDVHGKPGSKNWRRMDEVEQDDLLGINIFESRLTCLDADERHPAYASLIKALPVWEISVSGSGTHLFTRAAVPVDCPQQWYKDGHKLEVYGRNAKGRFIALTGQYLRGQHSLEDVLDTPPDLMALLLAEGWEPGSTTAKVKSVELPAELPPAPKLGRLDEWAALLDARDRTDPERGNGPWGRMSPAKQSRWSAMAVLMDRAALLVGSPAELASWWYASFPTLIGARGGAPDYAADRDREVSRAWASRPAPPGDVSRETLVADFGVDVNEEATNEVDQNDGDIGGNQPPAPQLGVSDEQIARDMLARFENRSSGIRYAKDLGKTYFLDQRSGLWRLDKDGRTEREIYTYNRELASAWADEHPNATAGAVRKLRLECGSSPKMGRVKQAVQAFGGISFDMLDTNPYLVGMVDGVYDVQTGKFRPAKLDEYVMRSTAFAPDPNASCPMFCRFLEQIFAHDLELIPFVQRWFGYCLTGLTTEQKIFFGYGGGQNGKSTLIELMGDLFGMATLGGYWQSTPAETLMERKQEPHSTEIAKLMGARLITATEVAEHATWNEKRLKEISGGDTLTGRFMRQDDISFRAVGKLTISGNHKPRLTSQGTAMKRRMLLVPFTMDILRADLELPAKLRTEAQAIMWWAIEGLRDWRRSGLRVPASVVKESEDYFVTEDVVRLFLSENVIAEAGEKIKVSELTSRLNYYITTTERRRGYGSQQIREELLRRGLSVELRTGNVQYFMDHRWRRLGDDVSEAIQEAEGNGLNADYGVEGEEPKPETVH